MIVPEENSKNAGATPFQKELYAHLIRWKHEHVTCESGIIRRKDKYGIVHEYPNDAILPDYIMTPNPMLYPAIVPGLLQHQERFPFKFHKHFNHVASSQAANMNLFLPILLHPRANEVFGIIKPGFKMLAIEELYKGFRIEFWDGNTPEEKGLLGDHTPNAGTDAYIAIAYFKHEDQLCLWLIEHKLTEKEFTECGGKKSPGRERIAKCDCSRSFADIIADKDLCYYHYKCRYEYWNLTEQNQTFFKNHHGSDFCPFSSGMNQLWRNQLLGFALERQGKFSKVTFSVVKHPRNNDLDNTIKEYQKLTGNDPAFSVLSLMSFIDAARSTGDIELDRWAAWYCELYNVY